MEEQEIPKIKQPPILFSKTQDIITKITAQLGGTLITYWNNPGGSVCHNDVVALYEILEKIGRQETLYLFIKSSGGDGQAALRLVGKQGASDTCGGERIDQSGDDRESDQQHEGGTQFLQHDFLLSRGAGR